MEENETVVITENSLVERVQEIVRLLADFDYRTGRYIRPEMKSGYWFRKVVAEADSETVSFTVTKNKDFLYQVIAEVTDEFNYLKTTWIHEDGVFKEREEHKGNKGHPVHTIDCFTDIVTDALVTS